MNDCRIILEIKEKSGCSLVFLGGRFGNTKKEKKEALKKENISLELLPAIDRLLKKNGLLLDNISGYKIITDVPRNWTSVRIAEITFKSSGSCQKKQTCARLYLRYLTLGDLDIFSKNN